MEMISSRICTCLAPTLSLHTALMKFLLNSYDADESTNRTTSAVEAPKPAEPVAAPAAPAASVGQVTEAAPVNAYQSQPAAQPSGYDNGYNNGAGNSYGAPPATEAPAEPESHGTGIKEDG